MAKLYFVYMHNNKINNKKYIGQTCNIEKRWEYNGCHYENSFKFYNALIKYGWNNFDHIILKENLSLEEANFWESYYINYYNSIENGYNIKSGGSHGKLSEEQKEKIKKSNKQTWLKKIKNMGEDNYIKQCRNAQKNVTSKKVMCVETKKIYNSISEASRETHIALSNISRVCNGERRSAGKDLITGQKLTWKFYDEKKEEN